MKKLIISTVLLTAISVSHATDIAKDDLGAAMQAQAQSQTQVPIAKANTTMASGFDHEDLAEKAPVGTMAYYVRLNENTQDNSLASTKTNFVSATSFLGY